MNKETIHDLLADSGAEVKAFAERFLAQHAKIETCVNEALELIAVPANTIPEEDCGDYASKVYAKAQEFADAANVMTEFRIPNISAGQWQDVFYSIRGSAEAYSSRYTRHQEEIWRENRRQERAEAFLQWEQNEEERKAALRRGEKVGPPEPMHV